MAGAVDLLPFGVQTVQYRVKENRDGEAQSTCTTIVKVISNLATLINISRVRVARLELLFFAVQV